MRIDYETLVGLGVMPDVARGIVNDLSMRRTQAQESGVEVDDSLTFENLKGLGMSDEQAKGLMNDASLQRIQQQESAAALEEQRAADAQARAEADELGSIRADQRAALMGRKEDITANLQALNIARMADAGQLVPGAEATDPDSVIADRERQRLQEQAEAIAMMNAALSPAAEQYGDQPKPMMFDEFTDDSVEAYRRNIAADEAIAARRNVDTSALPAGIGRQAVARLDEAQAAKEQEAKAKATREADLAKLELGVQQGQAQVDSLYNQAAIQALMNASQPMKPRTVGEAMKGTPTTAQAEMQQNVNLAREFFGRQGKVQRSKMKELEAQRRMKRHRDKEERMRDQMAARQKRFEASEERKEQAHLDRIELQEMLYGPEGTKTALAIDKLNQMTNWQQALIMERRLTRHAQLKMAQSKEGRAYLRDASSKWDRLWRQKQGEAQDARRRVDTARRDLDRVLNSIERDDTPEKQKRKAQLESTIFQAEERASAAERRSRIYERSAANAQRIVDSTQGRFGGTRRNTLGSVID